MSRETFTSRLGLVATMIGVAVGLGNVWRFPYMVGRFGGAAFVVVYLLLAVLIGIPALMAEWTLGRHTRRGSVGAFELAGLPGGRALGWIFFFAVATATGYYSNAIGWVIYHGAAELARGLGVSLNATRILPPDAGFDGASFSLQFVSTGLVIAACGLVLRRGLRSGIQKASMLITPMLFGILLLLVVRSLTLDGAGEGLAWLLLKFEPSDITGGVAMAALGQVVFSLALGGTFMVVYGSYLDDGVDLGRNAVWTVLGDTGAGLLAGLAIFPAVFAFGLEPASGPGLIFATLPQVFASMPIGWLFGSLFFLALASAAYLSAVAAFEVLVAGLADNTGIARKPATTLVSILVLLLALPPMINMRIFVPWDLTFGTGFQTFGALIAALTVGWSFKRSDALRQLANSEDAGPQIRLLYNWIRFVVPGAILTVGVWWFLTDVLGLVGPV
ncbi:MAG: sodium-dependent transporter [Longimicrobiales bacterium]